MAPISIEFPKPKAIILESSHLLCTPYSQVNIPVISAFKISQCAWFCYHASADCHHLPPGRLWQPPNWLLYTCLCSVFLCPQLQPICHTTIPQWSLEEIPNTFLYLTRCHMMWPLPTSFPPIVALSPSSLLPRPHLFFICKHTKLTPALVHL